MIYVDSSVLLGLYLDGPRSSEARAILDEREAKVSSFLIAVEVPIVLRRALPKPGDRGALDRCLRRFDADVRNVGLVDSLTDVAVRIRSDDRFAHCRSLDAIHACTALLLREWTGHAVRVRTLDARLEALSREIGLE